jgi:hypothetical protein
LRLPGFALDGEAMGTKNSPNIGLGVVIGVAIGLVMDNMVMGIGIGLALGIAVGFIGRSPRGPE